MQTTRLGRTNLQASRCSFGAIPIQRLSEAEAVKLLRRAYDLGVTLFDTARGYTDSEAKIGAALSSVRDKIIITTKTPSLTRAGILRDIETSLAGLKTDYIDVYQFHNPGTVPAPGGEAYETMTELKKAGKIRFIGITNHSREVAERAVRTGNYDTLQFPFSPLSSPEEMALAALCRENDVGVLAMKALSGGLITKAVTSFAFLWQVENIIPIWGIQHVWELEELCGYAENPPALTEELLALIEKDRRDLAGSFCRGCGYCLPCPAGIPINMAARISLLLGRSNPALYTTPEWRANMAKIENCTNCGHCKAHCPYGLDTPELLKSELVKYRVLAKDE